MKKGWKKTLVAVAVAAAVASSATAFATCGDVDNDGSFLVGDCVNIFDIIAGPPDVTANPCGTGDPLSCADLNGDGVINVGDAILCINAINTATTPTCTGVLPSISCPATINSAITQSQKWPTGCVVTLDGTIFVNPGVLLKIEHGVTVKGKASPTTDPVSALVFRRDSRIDAQGTANDPIVFTSDEPDGAKTVGGWGGVVFNGRGTVNIPGGEGLAEGLTGVPFGGNQPNESTGTFSFARVEFAGHVLSLDNELNSITMNALGRGTDFHHLEALRGKDDCYEWFGGNNFIHHVVAAACNDDNLDTQLGTQGGAQYALIVQHKASTDGNPHSNGFEADNNENGYDLLPRSNAKFCNITAVGYNQQTTGTGAGASSGALIRRGTGEQIANSIIMNYPTAAFKFDDNATMLAACSAGVKTGTVNVQDSIVFQNTALTAGSATGNGCDRNSLSSQFSLYGATGPAVDPLVDSHVQLYDPGTCSSGTCTVSGASCTADKDCTFSAVPTAGSPAGSLARIDCSTLDAKFDNSATADFIGAFKPGGTDWAQGKWINYQLN